MSEELETRSEEELAQLIADAKAALGAKIIAKRSDTIQQIRALAAEAGLVVEILTGEPESAQKSRGGRKGIPVPVKYRHGSNAWSGRGVRPKWLVEQLNAGRMLEEFAA